MWGGAPRQLLSSGQGGTSRGDLSHVEATSSTLHGALSYSRGLSKCGASPASARPTRAAPVTPPPQPGRFPSAWVECRLPEEQSDEVAILRGSRNKSKVKFAGVFSHAHHVLPRERQVSCPARGKEVVPRSRTHGGCVLTAERAPPPATARSAGA